MLSTRFGYGLPAFFAARLAAVISAGVSECDFPADCFGFGFFQGAFLFTTITDSLSMESGFEQERYRSVLDVLGWRYSHSASGARHVMVRVKREAGAVGSFTNAGTAPATVGQFSGLRA